MGPSATFKPGEPVRGHDEVMVNADCTTKALTLSRQWRTHGRGNTAKGKALDIVLYQGEWTTGMPGRYPFEFPAPDGPLTYRGHYLNVDWYLTARADIPWAFDPKDEKELLLVPGEGAAFDAGPSFEKTYSEKARSSSEGCSTAAGVIFGLVFGGGGIGALLLGIYLMTATRDTETGAIFAAVGAVFALLGLAIVFATLKRTVAERKLGKPQVVVEPQQLKRGGTVKVSIAMMPAANVELDAITVRLRGREIVASGHGTKRTTHTHVLHDSSQPVDTGMVSLSPGSIVHLEGKVGIPDDAALTFCAPDNETKWEIDLRIGIRGWPDWERTWPIVVRP